MTLSALLRIRTTGALRHRAGTSLALCMLAGIASLLLSGCFSVSRVETDVYTLTRRDTTVKENVVNAPGDRDNGTIYPSPKTVEVTRLYTQQDSLVQRYYPAFLRLGGIEAASFFAPGGSSDGAGNGLFGLYNLLSLRRKNDTKTFGANMYRIMPYEVRLRWFNDEPNWTIGFSPYETFIMQKDNRSEISSGEQLQSFINLYIRKRYFLRDRPPFVMVVPFLGISALPSQYINLGATLDVGSLGGFNIRGYAGFVGGTSLTEKVDAGTAGNGLSFPYLGIGVSALDFVNRTEDLFIEWKDQRNIALEVSGLNLDFVKSLSGQPAFGQDTKKNASSTVTGFTARLASANLPLPFGDHRLFVGTTLLDLKALSKTEISIGFLPIRVGYRMNLYKEDLSLEPFAEYVYYPSKTVHLGTRVLARLSDWWTLEGFAAYVSGSPNEDVLTGLGEWAVKESYSTFYIGFGIGIGDVVHYASEVGW